MRKLIITLAAVLALFAPAPAKAQATTDLLLVLAVDASGSVNQTRFELQRRGYADAFANPRVLRAIRSGPMQAIAVAVVQWTGPMMQARIIDWTVVEDAAGAEALSRAIAGAPRQLFGGGTSISGAIDYAARMFAEGNVAGERRVIDVSGDGANNSGRPAASARDAAVRAGIVINGLPILSIEPDLDAFYRDNVVGGPGAIMRPVADFEHFGEAILDKLIAEIADMPSSGRQRLAHATAPGQ